MWNKKAFMKECYADLKPFISKLGKGTSIVYCDSFQRKRNEKESDLICMEKERPRGTGLEVRKPGFFSPALPPACTEKPHHLSGCSLTPNVRLSSLCQM